MTDLDLDKIVNGYLQCSLFTGVTDDGEPMDYIYTVDDFEDSALDLALQECAAFVVANQTDVEYMIGRQFSNGQGIVTNEDVGIDLWYTSQGHGTGFWDREYRELGERLTEYCRHLPERNVFAPESDEFENGSTLIIE